MWAPSIWKYAIAAAVLPQVLLAQQAGNVTSEVHPSLTSEVCTKAGGCTTQATKVVLDANWRWLHNHANFDNCFNGYFNATLCPDPQTCAANCALEGANYKEDYGISTADTELSLTFITKSNRGSRLYLLQDDETYKHFKLLNREFTFDVDASQLPCGMNGALYFVEMDADGGKTRFPTNKAGAKFGTGYCDAQCPRDIKFINGEANMKDWTTPGKYQGSYGSCCQEMDVWEANSMATTLTPHTCLVDKQTRCTGNSCEDCDRHGCDFNPFRVGNQEFFGPGGKVDTKKPVTVVTRFVTDDNTDNGKLAAIQRWYVQEGKVIQNTNTSVSGVDITNELTDKFCEQAKGVFGQTNTHGALGGLAKMGEALQRGVVLTMSLWADYGGNMHWLDSTVPADQPDAPGAKRGNCPTSGGSPDDLAKNHPGAQVKFSNIKVGEFGSTTTVDLTPKAPTPAPTPTPTPTPIATSNNTAEVNETASSTPAPTPTPAVSNDNSTKVNVTALSNPTPNPAPISTSDNTSKVDVNATAIATPQVNTTAVNVSVDPIKTPAPVTTGNASVSSSSSTAGAALPNKTASNATTNSPAATHNDAHQSVGESSTTLNNQKQSAKRSANATASPSPATAQTVVSPSPITTNANPSAHKQYTPPSSEGDQPAGPAFTVIGNKATPAPSPETQSVPVKNLGFNDKTIGATSSNAATEGNSKLAVMTPSASNEAPGAPHKVHGSPQQQSPTTGSSQVKSDEQKPHEQTSTGGSPQPTVSSSKANEHKPQQRTSTGGSPQPTASSSKTHEHKPQQQTSTGGSPQPTATSSKANEHKPQQQTSTGGSPQPAATSSKAYEQKPQQQHPTAKNDDDSNGPAGVRANGDEHESSHPSSSATVTSAPAATKLESAASVREHGKTTHQGQKPAC